MKKLKVGFVLDDSFDSNDGVQQYVKTLGGWLASQGHTVHYLVGESKTNIEAVYSLSRNIGVRFNGNRLTIPLPANKKAIKNLLDRESYDIVHVQMPYSPLLAGRLINQVSETAAVVGTFHILPFGHLQKVGSQLLAGLQVASLKRFDAVASVSPAAQMFARTVFGIESTVVPNTIDIKKWQSPLPNHPSRVVFLGRLVPRKGCLQLLRAINSLQATLRSNLEVLIAGDGPERQKLEKFASKYSLDNVKFLGIISESDKASLLASAELAVFPSIGGESFGIVLIEAMAAGAGVVLGGNNPGYNSVLSDCPETLFDPKSSKSIASALQNFVEDKKLAKRVHKQQQQAVKRYDTDVVGEQILALYKQALLHHKREVR